MFLVARIKDLREYKIDEQVKRRFSFRTTP